MTARSAVGSSPATSIRVSRSAPVGPPAAVASRVALPAAVVPSAAPSPVVDAAGSIWSSQTPGAGRSSRERKPSWCATRAASAARSAASSAPGGVRTRNAWLNRRISPPHSASRATIGSGVKIPVAVASKAGSMTAAGSADAVAGSADAVSRGGRPDGAD